MFYGAEEEREVNEKTKIKTTLYTSIVPVPEIFLSMPPRSSERLSAPGGKPLWPAFPASLALWLAVRVSPWKALDKTLRRRGWLLFPAFLAAPGWQWLYSSKEAHSLGGASLLQQPLFPHLVGVPFTFKTGW